MMSCQSGFLFAFLPVRPQRPGQRQTHSPQRRWRSPSARPVARELLKELRDYFERNSRVEQPETTNDLSPLEEGLKFAVVGPDGPPPPPPGGQPVLRVHTFAKDNNRYRFEIRARVQA